MSFDLKNLPIKTKILTVIIASATAAAVGSGSLAAYLSYTSLQQEVSVKLQTLAETKANTIDRYLRSIEDDIILLSSAENTLDALHEFESGWNELGNNQQDNLQAAYIDDNPNPIGSKELLDRAPEDNSYNIAHAQFHPWLREFLYKRGYYDIFLFDTDGNLIYSVFKELDYATNMFDGEYRDTDLANSFRDALNLNQNETAFFDFKPYAPSNGAPAAFLSAPIIDDQGDRSGVLVFQMPIDRLNTVAGSTKGLGDTGQSFIVGEDLLLRTDIASTEDNEILRMRFDNDAVTDGLKGKAGFTKISNDGEETLVGFAPLQVHGVNFVIVASQKSAEAFAGIVHMISQVALITILLIGAFATIGYLLARSITNPIKSVIGDMTAIVDGDLEREIDGRERGDEVGQIAKALDIFKTNSLEIKRMEASQREKELADQEKRRKDIFSLADSLESQVGLVANSVVAATANLEESTQGLTRSSVETSSMISAVAAAAEQSSVGAETIASAIGQLNAASREIAQQVEATSSATRDAVEKTQTADDQVQTLVNCADKIGEFVAMISEIAEQTNLLALNATIEAARAGQAGSGFAVVASEVKSLASQTASATDDISQQVKAIQSATNDTVSAIRQIRATIESVDNSSSTVAAAVQEQSVTVDEINRNIEEAANSSVDVSSRCGQMDNVAKDNHATISKVGEAAHELKTHGQDLKSSVDTFLKEIRASA